MYFLGHVYEVFVKLLDSFYCQGHIYIELEALSPKF